MKKIFNTFLIHFFLLSTAFSQNASFSTAFWKKNCSAGFFPSAGGCVSVCPVGYDYVNAGSGLKCYSQLKGPSTYSTSYNDCNADGGTVASATSASLCPLLSGGCAAVSAGERFFWRNLDGATSGNLATQSSTTYGGSASFSDYPGTLAPSCSAFFPSTPDTCDGTHYYFCQK